MLLTLLATFAYAQTTSYKPCTDEQKLVDDAWANQMLWISKYSELQQEITDLNDEIPVLKRKVLSGLSKEQIKFCVRGCQDQVDKHNAHLKGLVSKEEYEKQKIDPLKGTRKMSDKQILVDHQGTCVAMAFGFSEVYTADTKDVPIGIRIKNRKEYLNQKDFDTIASCEVVKRKKAVYEKQAELKDAQTKLDTTKEARTAAVVHYNESNDKLLACKGVDERGNKTSVPGAGTTGKSSKTGEQKQVK